MKKGCAVGIILLFIGVAVAPSINSTVVKASNDNDLVEVTSQACGIQGFGNTTVELTKEQYQNLEQYLVDFRARLNQTTTREEAIPIFKDAVVELDKYGLLPKGMSVGRAQRFVTGQYMNQKRFDTLKKIMLRNQISFSANENWNCLFVGISNNLLVYSIFWHIYYNIVDYFDFILDAAFWIIAYTIYVIQPFFLWRPIILGENENSWVFTAGSNGIVTWTGKLVGDIQGQEYPNTGVLGFTGIKIGGLRSFIIGTALHVAMHQI